MSSSGLIYHLTRSFRIAGGKSEVTFKDLEKGQRVDIVDMPGWAKITGYCKEARKDGWKYAWIDSCCIDKSSSAELTEAINSMFGWYRNAQVCYAYLSDIFSIHGNHSTSMRNSRWFTRGWTLQELLAPKTVIFFDRTWTEMGTKTTLETLISDITGIENLLDFEKACIAQKMSWASERQTLRVEDKAYCLLGLFEINMPLLYGEGKKAFLRLQTEILRISDDESIFAWTEGGHELSGLLASSPAAFKDSGDVSLSPNSRLVPYAMTNKGLQIALSLTPLDDSYYIPVLPQENCEVVRRQTLAEDDAETFDPGIRADLYHASICCIKKNDIDPIDLILCKHPGDTETYSRVSCYRWLPMEKSTAARQAQKTVFVHQAEFSIRNFMTNVVVIRSEELQSQLRGYPPIPTMFFPGVFVSKRFFLTSEPRELTSGDFGISIDKGLRLRMRSGILVLSFSAHNAMFGLEIHYSGKGSPGVALIPNQAGSPLSNIMRGCLNHPVREVVQRKERVLLPSGVPVSVAVEVHSAGYNIPYFFIDIMIKDPGRVVVVHQLEED